MLRQSKAASVREFIPDCFFSLRSCRPSWSCNSGNLPSSASLTPEAAGSAATKRATFLADGAVGGGGGGGTLDGRPATGGAQSNLVTPPAGFSVTLLSADAPPDGEGGKGGDGRDGGGGGGGAAIAAAGGTSGGTVGAVPGGSAMPGGAANGGFPSGTMALEFRSPSDAPAPSPNGDLPASLAPSGTQKRPLQRGQVTYEPIFLVGTASGCLQRGQSSVIGIVAKSQ